MTAPPKDVGDGMTNQGRLLFVLGLSIALSAYSWARTEIAGMLFQPYLVPLGILFLTMSAARFRRVPRTTIAMLWLFCAVYCLVIIVNGGDMGEIVKTLALGATVSIVAAAGETEADVRAGAVGYAIAMGIVSVQAMIGDVSNHRGLNPFGDVANENAYSLYALPMLLLAGHFITEKATPHRTRIILAVASGATVIGIFSTSNRSGYIGVAAVGLLLVARGRRPRDVVALVIVGVGIYWAFTNYGDTSTFETERDRTEETDDRSGWDRRVEIWNATVAIGLNNPILGVGPQNVPEELGARFERANDLDAHNLVGTVWAGGGVPLMASFVGFLVAAWLRPKEWRAAGAPSQAEKRARGLVRLMLLLLLIRGIFTQDVINTPGFMVAIGLTLALERVCGPALLPSEAVDKDSVDQEVIRQRSRNLFAEARASYGPHPRTLVQHPRRMTPGSRAGF